MRNDGFSRHRRALENVTLPGDRTAFRLGESDVGWVTRDFAGHLLDLGCDRAADAIRLADPASLPDLALRAAVGGAFRWRDEAFDVRAEPDGLVLGQIDRGALPCFGIAAEGVHLNGLVERPDGLHLWVARRAANKALDPGLLDHLVAGGIGAGMTPRETLVKEAHEEAGLSAPLARTAIHRGMVSYVTERPEGLRRDRLHCYDLALPETFIPEPHDGEVEAFALWPMARVVEAVRNTDAFKFNVNLVLIGLFERLGLT